MLAVIAHVLSFWPVAVGVNELAIHAHLVNLLETEAVVPQIRLAETPPVRQDLMIASTHRFAGVTNPNSKNALGEHTHQLLKLFPNLA